MSDYAKLGIAIAWVLSMTIAYALGKDFGSSPRGTLLPSTPPSMEEAIATHDPIQRALAIESILASSDAAGIEALLPAIEEARHWFGPDDHALLMDAWVPLDADAAIDWAFARPQPLDRRAKVALVSALGFHDPVMASVVVRSEGASQQAEGLHLHMIAGWARSDRRSALTEYIENLPQGRARQQATKTLSDEILESGPEALIEWSDAIPIDAARQFKRATFQKSVHALSREDPARAAEWLERHIDERYATNSAKVLMVRWLASDPAAAMSWLADFGTVPGEKDLPKTSFKSWMEIDPVAAEAWAREAPSARHLDSMYRVLVRRYFDEDPATALEWTHRIHDEMIRKRVQTAAGRAWWRKDPDAFMAWLPDGRLDNQVRDLILNAAGAAAAPPPGSADRETDRS